MVVPALVAGAIAAPIVGGILQWQNSKEAMAASSAERARIQALLDKIQAPQFNPADLTSQEYKVVGQLAPQAIPLIEEAAPQLVQRSEAGNQGLQTQLNAMQRLRNIGQGGADVQSQALIEQAMREAQIQNQGQQQSIIDSMARRGGGLNSGLGFAQALSSQANANQLGANQGTNAALQAYQNKLQALRDSANLGGQVEASDRSMQGSNADIINQFNARMAQMRQQNAQLNTQNTNQASAGNLAARQAAADQNTGLVNSDAQRRLNMEQQRYQNEMQKAEVNAGLSAQAQKGITSNAAQNNQAIQGTTQGISAALLGADELYGGNGNEMKVSNKQKLRYV